MTDGLPRDLLAGSPDDIERGLDEWVAGFEHNAARYRELQHRMDEVRISATSPGGVVTVTVDANGSLTDVRFSERVCQTSPGELSRQLLAAVNTAKAGIAGRAREIADETLGSDARESADRIVGYYEQRFSGLQEPAAPEQPGRSHRAGPADDDFGESPIFGRR